MGAPLRVRTAEMGYDGVRIERGGEERMFGKGTWAEVEGKEGERERGGEEEDEAEEEEVSKRVDQRPCSPCSETNEATSKSDVRSSSSAR